LSDATSSNGKISIVIPCYNRGDLLREALASIEAVRNSNLLEVIIVDDGSTDAATCSYLDHLVQSSPYRILHQPNRGLAAARNTGIRAAQGEFILPLDDDDLIRDVYLTRGVEYLRAHSEIGLIYGDAELFGEQTGVWHCPEFDLPKLIAENYIHCCVLFRKCIWEAVKGYDEEMRLGYEDWEFWLRIANRGWNFQHMDEVVFDYRKRRGTMIEGAVRRYEEIVIYIFAKPENRSLCVIRDQARTLEHLVRIQQSRDYRVGHLLVEPLRRLKRLLFPR
jgi:glycosyltransferase involved in cell wall biosynthesis